MANVQNVVNLGGTAATSDMQKAWAIIDDYQGMMETLPTTGTKRTRNHDLQQNRMDMLADLGEHFTEIAARNTTFVHEVIFPVFVTEAQYIKSEDIIFEHQQIEPLAPEAVANITQFSTDSNESALQPYGINVKWEIGDIGTVKGKKDFTMAMIQVTKGIIYTMELEGMRTVLRAGRSDLQQELINATGTEWVTQFQRAKNFHAIGQRGEKGLIKGLQQMVSQITIRGLTPTVAVMNPTYLPLLSYANNLFVEHYKAGNKGPERLLRNTPIAQIGDVKFYHCPLENQTKRSEYTTCMLDTEVQSGYYYYLKSGDHVDKLDLTSKDSYNSLCGAFKLWNRDTGNDEIIQATKYIDQMNFVFSENDGFLTNENGDQVYRNAAFMSNDMRNILAPNTQGAILPRTIYEGTSDADPELFNYPFVMPYGNRLQYVHNIRDAYRKADPSGRLLMSIENMFGLATLQYQPQNPSQPANNFQVLNPLVYVFNGDGTDANSVNAAYRVGSILLSIPNKSFFIELMSLGIPPPFSVLLLRPFVTDGTSALTLTAGGKDFGECAMSNITYTESKDNQAGNGSHQTRVKFIHHVRNADCTMTVDNFFQRKVFPNAGGSNNFFTQNSWDNFVQDKNCRRDTPDSLFALVCGFNEDLNIFHGMLDITGNTGYHQDNMEGRPHYSTAPFFRKRIFMEFMNKPPAPTCRGFNRICYVGSYRLHSNTQPESFDVKFHGQGFNCYDVPGHANVLNGGQDIYR